MQPSDDPGHICSSCKHLQKDLEEAQAKAADLHRENQRLLGAALEKIEVDVYRRDIEYFIRELESLRYHIKNWANCGFNSPRTWRFSPTSEPGSSFGDLCDDWELRLRDDTARPLLVRAFVWKILSKELFARGSKRWISARYEGVIRKLES